MSYLFAETFNQILVNGLEESIQVSQAWENNWALVFQGTSAGGETLFAAINDLGLLLAMMALIISGVGLYRALVNQQLVEWYLLFSAVIAVSLFAHGGALMGEVILALRAIINQISDQIIVSTLASVRIDEALQTAQDNLIVRQAIENAYRPCLAENGPRQVSCLENAATFAQQVRLDFSEPGGLSGWLQDLVARFQEAGLAVRQEQDYSLIGLFSPVWQPIVYSILFWMMQAYQHLLEAMMILTGLMAPLAVGMSLFIFGVPAIIGWLTGFFSLGMAKIAFNILIGLAAVVVTNAGVNDPAWFPIFVGLGAPFFSFALSTGGGLALWSSFTSLGSTAAIVATGGLSHLAAPKRK